jgi:putative redox protein
MTLCRGVYKGDLIIESVHEISNERLLTDAPLDNQGKGASFSPTDLVGVALGTCILTTMGIIAARDQLDISGARYTVEKKMRADAPRRIAGLSITFELPSGVSDEMRRKLERTAETCPVHRSLSPEVETRFTFNYVL